ncbi:GGDEF domain-containing protein [Deinococcus ruber]|uniref:GGDEF domain-containing protein n=1 Tax=Deinococcus ruber TaxID=1848197 RepID=A0A918CDI7_9DEIO|nr:diguanylate cyclase [Deinococcus ruber]GGR18067.1 hypothetical protein GCM10008957_33550 [Deinococcus ruber]
MAYRLYMGGVGAPAGMAGLLICVISASAFRSRFRRTVITWHDLWVPVVIFATTDLTMLLVPERGLQLFSAAYLPAVIAQSLGLLLVFAVLQSHFNVIGTTLEFEQLAYRDGLTGALNRRAFERDLKAQGEAPSHLLLLDLDHFKRINDQRGHPFGDRVLTQMSELLHDTVLDHGPVYRIGGEEFAVMIKTADPHGAVAVAERIRQRVETQLSSHVGATELPITVSIGLTPWLCSGGQTFRQADELLYSAKQNGRNRVMMAGM